MDLKLKFYGRLFLIVFFVTCLDLDQKKQKGDAVTGGLSMALNQYVDQP